MQSHRLTSIVIFPQIDARVYASCWAWRCDASQGAEAWLTAKQRSLFTPPITQVRGVRDGVRRVIVAEWWAGGAPGGAVQRPADTSALFEASLEIEPNSASLHT